MDPHKKRSEFEERSFDLIPKKIKHKITRLSSFKIPLFQRRYENDFVACIDVLKTQPERKLNLLKFKKIVKHY
jgi:hypothetical protein